MYVLKLRMLSGKGSLMEILYCRDEFFYSRDQYARGNPLLKSLTVTIKFCVDKES
jgi:hypothetical protein